MSLASGGGNAAARVHRTSRRRGGRTATRRVRTAANAGDRLFQQRHAIDARKKCGGVSERVEGGRTGGRAEPCDRVRLGRKSVSWLGDASRRSNRTPGP